MKLRNKNTGEIVDAWSFYDGNESVNLKYFTDDGQVNLEYRSLAKLNEEWEDYKPAEPLIKDEKIRKAVRAWADIVPESEFRYDRFGRRLYTISKYISSFSISFPTDLDLIEMKDYTLEELCGEEEE